MSSKNFIGFTYRFRNKSIDKLFSPNVTTSYQYIENFDNVSEDDCIKLDNINREIYKKNLNLFESISKKLDNKNAMFKIDTPPVSPPEPNNHEKYIYNKIRNSHQNVIYQSYAINYLLNKGYKIIFDKSDRSEVSEISLYEFEPYEAIELFNKLEKVNIELLFKNKSIQNTNLLYNLLNTNSNSNNNKRIQVLPAYTYNNYNNNNNNNYNNNNYNDNDNDLYPDLTKLSSSAPPTVPINVPTPSAPPSPYHTQPKQCIYGPPASRYLIT